MKDIHTKLRNHRITGMLAQTYCAFSSSTFINCCRTLEQALLSFSSWSFNLICGWEHKDATNFKPSPLFCIWELFTKSKLSTYPLLLHAECIFLLLTVKAVKSPVMLAIKLQRKMKCKYKLENSTAVMKIFLVVTNLNSPLCVHLVLVVFVLHVPAYLLNSYISCWIFPFCSLF